MPDREQLYTALRNADAAGDTKAAQRLTAYIQSLPADGAAPAADPEQGHNLFDTLAAIPGHIKEAVTGDKRHTATTDTLPDWAGMPELNSFSMASAKTGLGTLLANPAETVKVIQANFPGVQARQDDKGNFLLRSSIDGKEYAIKPGFQMSDIPRTLAGIAAFTPAGRATTIGGAAAASAATQAAIEGTQALTGGEFNPGEVAVAGALGAAVPAAAQAVRAAAAPAKQLLQRARGVNPAAAVDPLATASAEAGAGAEMAAQPGAAATAEVPAAAPLPASDLANTARKAAEGGIGSKSATQVLAEQAAPDAKVVEAAKRLGIEEYLQPDHVTTNQAFRELSQAVKSIPGSEARAAEMAGLEKVGQRANDLIEEVGGTHDASSLSADVKASLQATHDEIKARADGLYDEIRAAVPARSEAAATNVLDMINARSKDLGGTRFLSSMEKMVLSKLSPRKITPKGDTGAPGILGADGMPLRPAVKPTPVLKQPTYTLLDDVRRDLTAARIQRTGPFKDSDTRLITMLEGALRKDQQAAAEKFGMGAKWDLAQKTSAAYKAIQDDLSALFGKDLDKSIVRSLSGSVKLLSQGDTSGFIRLVKSIPESMRQEVVASGLNTAFGKSAANGAGSFAGYARWYEGLLKNKQAYTAVMTNLPQPARKQLSDLYRVARSVSAATRERITTGRINAIKDELKPADHLGARLYDAAKHQAVAVGAGTAAGGATGAVLGPAAGAAVGAAVTSALSKGAKSEAIKAVDKLIVSQEFAELAKKAATGTAPEQKRATLRLVHSAAWKRFAHAANQPINPTAAERWVTQALQNNNQQR